MSRMGEKGQLTGAKDRHGVEIRIGDTLRFDFNEWNRSALNAASLFGKEPDGLEECVFVMEYKDGELQHPGVYSDLSKWCEIIKPATTKLDDLLAKCDPNAPLPEDRKWVDAPPVGREII